MTTSQRKKSKQNLTSMNGIGTIMTIVPKLAGVINTAKGVFAVFNAVCNISRRNT